MQCLTEPAHNSQNYSQKNGSRRLYKLLASFSSNYERKIFMAETPIVIHEYRFQKMKTVLARLLVECAARVVFLVDRDGQPIAYHGDIGDMDTTSFSSLAAGNVAATSSMAKLIGEDVFPAVVHEGERESIFISVIGRSLLVVVLMSAQRSVWSNSERKERVTKLPKFWKTSPAIR